VLLKVISKSICSRPIVRSRITLNTYYFIIKIDTTEEIENGGGGCVRFEVDSYSGKYGNSDFLMCCTHVQTVFHMLQS
jgi:hypothetical protein